MADTLLLSHLPASQHLLLVTTKQVLDGFRQVLVFNHHHLELLFKLPLTGVIDLQQSANLLFTDQGLFLEGRLPGHDYPAVTLWLCWASDGKERWREEYSSDFGMLLTGAHAPGGW